MKYVLTERYNFYRSRLTDVYVKIPKNVHQIIEGNCYFIHILPLVVAVFTLRFPSQSEKIYTGHFVQPVR